MAAICVFCGSASGNLSSYAELTKKLGRMIAESDHQLIYGGGSLGLMGVIADEVLACDGRVTGVIPEALANVELMHSEVTDMRVVEDMHRRKALMHDLADVYIALPGGFGTMEELFEVLCWAQLDFHRAPIAILNVDGYYDGLISLIDSMVRRDFLDANCRSLLTVVSEIGELKDWLTNMCPR